MKLIRSGSRANRANRSYSTLETTAEGLNIIEGSSGVRGALAELIRQPSARLWAGFFVILSLQTIFVLVIFFVVIRIVNSFHKHFAVVDFVS